MFWTSQVTSADNSYWLRFGDNSLFCCILSLIGKDTNLRFRSHTSCIKLYSGLLVLKLKIDPRLYLIFSGTRQRGFPDWLRSRMAAGWFPNNPCGAQTPRDLPVWVAWAVAPSFYSSAIRQVAMVTEPMIPEVGVVHTSKIGRDNIFRFGME